LGSAVVAEFGRRGYDVVGLSRSAGGDASDEATVRDAFGRLSRLDALVNNAAQLIAKPLVDMSAEEWDAQIASGLRAAFLCSREAFRRMKEGGAIVNVSSLSGVVGAEKFPRMSAYVAAKSGLAGLTEALAVEGAPLGIRVNAISPGAIDTPMLKISAVPGPRLEAAAIARVIVWLAGAESAPLTGANIRMDP
jgi:NAD(P)-dependent dehydrogenase (short-subunit alcohol dehydrogenase family)